MSNPRDLRDPTKLGESLIEYTEDYGGTVRECYDKYSSILKTCPNYVSPLHPHDRYGDPRCIPSTLPN